MTPTVWSFSEEMNALLDKNNFKDCLSHAENAIASDSRDNYAFGDTSYSLVYVLDPAGISKTLGKKNKYNVESSYKT